MRKITSLLILFGCFAFHATQIYCKTTNVLQVDSTKFNKLKAVLVVGHQEDGTQEAVSKMEGIATFLRSKKIKVICFYDTAAKWTNIVTAAKGAHFFIYSGHGTTLGENGNVGGFCVKSMVSSQKITEDLKLAKNAIVIFKSVCYGAGSSAGDNKDIGKAEAEKRVSEYAKPFFSVGATAYFANNMGGGVEDFLKAFFAGKSMHECYEASLGWGTKTELNKAYKYDATKNIVITSCHWEGKTTRTTYTNGVKKVEEVPSVKDYPIAYVANSLFTINEILTNL